jgi:5-oxopent-3-ene-1,2,5-tricarboxylate decarboxylase / 2-hydroxyhepta-2,4-diene-1,7-dioate isomerase
MSGDRHSVIGVALNFRETLVRLASAFTDAPYQKLPQAPVLYLKTPNTWVAAGDEILCPKGINQLRMGGTVGFVFSQAACNVSTTDALRHIQALAVVNDISIPHDSYYRPALRERCSDSFCSIGSPVSIDPAQLENDFEINVLVNGVQRSTSHTSSLVRSIPQLIQDVSEFMTLRPGDILLIGEPDTSPIVGPGDMVRIEIPDIGSIENQVVAS